MTILQDVKLNNERNQIGIGKAGVNKTICSSDGTQISWLEFGDGETLIISPALGTPVQSWLAAIGVLSTSFKIIFLLTRGGYEGPIPNDSCALTVERRAEDIAELVDFLEVDKFLMVGHSSGVAPLVLSLSNFQVKPKNVALFSSRYGKGQPINSENLIKSASADPGLMRIVQTILVSFSPKYLADFVNEKLNETGRLPSLLRAFDYSRAFEYTDIIDPGNNITFIIAEDDPADVRQSTYDLVKQYPDEQWTVKELPNVGHFFIQDDGLNAAKVIVELFADK